MTVTIHQPHYLPWLGLVHKIAAADRFILLDDVQFEKHGWQNRTRYSTPRGLEFLTLPVHSRGVVSRQIPVAAVPLADPEAGFRHFQTLRHRYARSPGWPEWRGRLEPILCRRWEKLGDLCRATMELSLGALGVERKLESSAALRIVGTRTGRLVNLVQAVGGTRYLSGAGGRDYLDVALFERAGIEVAFQEFAHPVWRQRTDAPFAAGAFALEWLLEEPELARAAFHEWTRSA
jgi:hypothetical protein